MDSKNLKQKFEKKLKRHQRIVEKEANIKCTDTPSKHLAICNVGQVNGLTETKILSVFKDFGTIEAIILLPGKSCSFIAFKTTESAQKAIEKHNGQLKMAQDNKPVFLSCIEELPQINDKKIWKEFPPGLIILEDFITENEENNLICLCGDFDDSNLEGNSMKNRQVKHFGYEFRYDINNVDKTQPLPDKIPNECDFLWQRLKETKQLCKNFIPDQLTINHYKPGQGIPPHIDTHSAFEDPIISLSLGSAVVMEFKKNLNHHCLLLPQRSLLIMSGESRYSWTHGITPRKFDAVYTDKGYDTLIRSTRISFTFRKILQGDFQCNFKSNCDSNSKQVNKIEDNTALELENQHVHKVYENIASHFSETRHKPWPNVLDFVKSFDFGTILLDVGCGNGKYLGCNQNICEVGCDASLGLIEVCKARGFEAFTSNCLNIPFKNESTDGALSIAVIHHLANESRRLQAISELVRVLRVNGKALIYVWAKDQLKNNTKSSYIKQDRKNRKSTENIAATNNNNKEEEVVVANGVSLPVHTNRTQFKHSDMLVPWKLKKLSSNEKDKDEKMFFRFYHVFEDGELELLCKQIPNVNIIKSFYDQGNYCVILEKVK